VGGVINRETGCEACSRVSSVVSREMPQSVFTCEARGRLVENTRVKGERFWNLGLASGRAAAARF
jgi:hypothetical protein